MLSFIASVHGRFSFQRGLPLRPQRRSADGHAAAEPSDRSTFLEASSRPHEEGEGTPCRAVQRGGGSVRGPTWAGEGENETSCPPGTVSRQWERLSYMWILNGFICLIAVIHVQCSCQVSLTSGTRALHLFSRGSFGKRNKEMSHINVHEHGNKTRSRRGFLQHDTTSDGFVHACHPPTLLSPDGTS